MKLSRPTIKPARIEMIPLIDIVFLLLVFFIYAMLSMAVHCVLPVQLPSSNAVQLDTEKAIAITLQAEADSKTIAVFVDTEPVPIEELTTVLRQKSENHDKNEQEVQIYGDQSVSYQQLFEVLDRIKAAGLNRISLAAEIEKK